MLIARTGAIGNLASAATVAASAFEMKVTDPTPLIRKIDWERWNRLRRYRPSKESLSVQLCYVEPAGREAETHAVPSRAEGADTISTSAPSNGRIQGKVQRLEDYIDTDAVRT